jgi:hypothetical protein
MAVPVHIVSMHLDHPWTFVGCRASVKDVGVIDRGRSLPASRLLSQFSRVSLSAILAWLIPFDGCGTVAIQTRIVLLSSSAGQTNARWEPELFQLPLRVGFAIQAPQPLRLGCRAREIWRRS